MDKVMVASAGRIVVVGNLKGGTGKSTVTVNLAGALVAAGRRIAVVDADPQATAAGWIERGDMDMLCVRRPLDRVDEVGAWLKSARALARSHDFVLVDLPSVVVPALAAAYLVADLIVVPAAPTGIDLAGTRRVLRHVAVARAERPNNPPAVMIVPSRVPGLRLTTGPLAQLGEPLGPTIALREAHDLAHEKGQWVGHVAPGSRAQIEVERLADAVLAALGEAASFRHPAPAPSPFHIAAEEASGAVYLDQLPPVAGRDEPWARRGWLARLFGRRRAARV